MMNKRSFQQIGSLAALIVFGLFAACVLLVLFSGAGAYSRLSARDRQAYEARTGAQYITTRVHQAESPAAVTLVPFGDGDALCLADETDYGTYYTLVYCSGGWLRELYTGDITASTPEAGEKLMESGGVAFTLTDTLLTVTLHETDGTDTTVVLSLDKGVDAA